MARSILLAVAFAVVALQSGSPAAAWTLRVDLAADVDSPDPALGYSLDSWQMEYATCGKLVNSGPGSAELRPDLADLPEVSPDGRTYTFRIRPGQWFSPPSREPVTAAVIQRSIQRAISPVLQDAGAPGSFYLQDVTSITASGNELRIRLSQPAGDFLHRIALPFFCVVPSSTPMEPVTAPPPSAGPYFVSDFAPQSPDHGGAIELSRNPRYGGERPSRPDQIVYRTGVDPAKTLADVLRGRTDYTPDQLSDAAYIDNASRVAVNPRLGYWSVAINTLRVTDVDVRQAINFALDRPAVAGAFGPFAVSPAADYIPPLMPGFSGAHLYPLGGPDVPTALALLHGSHPALTLYTCDSPVCLDVADVISANLGAVGAVVSILALPRPELLARLFGNPSEPFDIAVVGAAVDYADPVQIINTQFASEGPLNVSHFADADADARMAVIGPLVGPARAAAYAELDRELMERAPLAVIGTVNARDFFGLRVGCKTFNPVYGIDLASLCRQ